MRMRPFQIYLTTLIIIEIILSLYIVYEGSTGNAFCIYGTGCADVQNSEYGKVFGIKAGVFGIICFSALLLLYLYGHKEYKKYRYYFTAALIGTVYALYFLYVQFFILGKVCSSCFAVDTLMIVIGIMSTREFFRLRKYY